MHGLPADSYRAGPVPEVSGEGDGARMLAATLSYELLRDGQDRAGAVRLARFALEGDRLLAVDNGLLWIVAANVLLLADDDLGDFWDRALARAHATGGLFAALSVNLWRGFAQWRRGQLDDALQSLADAVEQQRVWGISGATSTYAAAFTLGVLTDLGDLDAAASSLDAGRGLPWVGEGGRLLREAAARLLVEQGRPSEALDELTAPVDYPRWSTLPGLRGAGSWRGRWPRSGVPTRRSRWRRRRSPFSDSGVRPPRSGRPCGCWVSCAALRVTARPPRGRRGPFGDVRRPGGGSRPTRSRAVRGDRPSGGGAPPAGRARDRPRLWGPSGRSRRGCGARPAGREHRRGG